MNPEEDKQYPWWRRSLDTLRYALRIPYTLNVEVIQPSRRSGRAYVFIHGIGNTLHSWDEVCRGMPDDARLIKVDLLGFGDSPKPRRAVYDARFQARCVLKTLLGLRFARRPVIVGHSLGALVAIEIARRYPVLFKSFYVALLYICPLMMSGFIVFLKTYCCVGSTRLFGVIRVSWRKSYLSQDGWVLRINPFL